MKALYSLLNKLQLVLLSSLWCVMQHQSPNGRHATFHRSIFQSENKGLCKNPFLFQGIRSTNPSLRQKHLHKDCGEIAEGFPIPVSMQFVNDGPERLHALLALPMRKAAGF